MEINNIEIYNKLSDLYRNGTPMHELIIVAKKMFEVKEEGVIQLIGEKPIGVLREESIGRLIGIKEGFVIFSSSKNLKKSGGMLEKKCGHEDNFWVRPFFPYSNNLIGIRKPQKYDPNYPLYVYNNNDYWGIKRRRWEEEMKKWLDKFLP